MNRCSQLIGQDLPPPDVEVDRLAETVDRLGEIDWKTRNGNTLESSLVAIEQQLRRIEAVKLAAIAELDARGVSAVAGDGSAVKWLTRAYAITTAEARRTVTLAGLLPDHVQVADRLADGTLNVAKARLIVDKVEGYAEATGRQGLDGRIMTDTRLENFEQALVAIAPKTNQTGLGTSAGHLRQLYLAGDDRYDKDRADHQARSMRVATCDDGNVTLSGQLPPEPGAKLTALLDGIGHADACKRKEDGLVDDRTPEQRRADAFISLIDRLAKAADRPIGNGAPVQILVTIGVDQLVDAATGDKLHLPAGAGFTIETGVIRVPGYPELDGRPISLEAFKRLADDSDMRRLLLGPASEPLDLGRNQRLFGRAARVVFTAATGGCAWPMCDANATWSQAHHIIAWSDGGPTDLDNGVLACTDHHKQLDAGYQLIRTPDGQIDVLAPKGAEALDAQRDATRAAAASDDDNTPRFGYPTSPEPLLTEGMATIPIEVPGQREPVQIAEDLIPPQVLRAEHKQKAREAKQAKQAAKDAAAWKQAAAPLIPTQPQEYEPTLPAGLTPDQAIEALRHMITDREKQDRHEA